MGCSNSRSTKVHSANPVKSQAAAVSSRSLKRSFTTPHHADKLLSVGEGDDVSNKSVALKVEKESSLKVRPPFRNLAAFNVGAIVLSYVGYEDEVYALLCLLNRNAKLY